MVEEYVEERDFSIETPIGSIKSDSGNHFVDVMSVVLVVCFLYIGRVYIKKIFKKI